MASPSTIIDASLAPWSNDVYFVIEATNIWRTDNLTSAGAATWTKVYNGSGEFAYGATLEFRQIKATTTTGLVYALGLAIKDGETDYTGFFFRSTNSGATWIAIEIAGLTNTPKAYTVDAAAVTLAFNGSFYVGYTTHTRKGSSPNPWAMAYSREGAYDVGFDYRAAVGMPANENQYLEAFQSSAVGAGIPRVAVNNSLSAGQLTTLGGWLNTYFGGVEGVAWEKFISSWAQSMPYEAQRVRAGFVGTGGASTVNAWVFWNSANSGAACFDFGLTNNAWVYAGGDTTIQKSTDGGYTWSEISTEGADDILVDPQLAGVIYFWTPDGELYIMSAGVLVDDPFLDGGKYQRHTRIAKQLNGGDLWVIDGYGNLSQRSSGLWTTRVSGICAGGSLRAYLGSPVQLVYLDSTGIWYSSNGTSFTNKKGGWTYAPADPKAIHLMKP